MKKISVITLLALFISSLFAQSISLVKEFPFGRPFVFKDKWNEDEGPIPGPGQLYFLNNDTILTTDGVTGTFVFFDKNWNVIQSNTRGWGLKLIFVSNNAILTGVFENAGIADPIWLYPKEGPYDNPIKLSAPKRYSSGGMLMTGKWVFNKVQGDQLISWELQGRSLKYRDEKDTEELLTQKGIELGYKKDSPPYGFPQLGSRFVTFMNVPEPVVPNQFNGYSFNSQQVDDFGIKTNPYNFVFVGRDLKGLYYFWTITPTLENNENEPYRTETNPQKRLVFGIADPWTRRLIFRSILPDEWTPPVSQTRGLLGTYPISVDLKGQIYFFDADEDRQVYELKRLSNDWWKELGADTRIVGIVNDNRVRIRDNPSTNSKVTGYIYENEYAWVKEQSAAKDTIDGKTAPWYLLEMSDGRKGWVFGAFVDIQN